MSVCAIASAGSVLNTFKTRPERLTLGPFVGGIVGVMLILFALMSELTGSRQRIFVLLRNSLILVFCIGLALAFLLFLIGPLH